ncbi:hypothetical protein DPMN_074886 [Dreissena polymorpha]|uniref:Uncharacterized protein n=1 Tax=Dreissena polymorpha TaxID=45954 RepID=A0A9D3YJG2_DREPO|nr:hypothetical protein DPMN_074886 [Dreissena polymorpha]
MPNNLNPTDWGTRGGSAENLMSISRLVGPPFSGSAENEVLYCLVNPHEEKEVGPELTTMATNVTQKTKLGSARFSRFLSCTRLLIALSCIKKRCQ